MVQPREKCENFRRTFFSDFHLIHDLSLSLGASRIARRSSVNTVKPPPPVRRSSSVTPSHHGDTNVSFSSRFFSIFHHRTLKNVEQQIDKTDTKFTLNLNSKLINHSRFFTHHLCFLTRNLKPLKMIQLMCYFFY